MLLHPKIHTFCLVKYPYKQTNVNYIALLSQIINTRYLSAFQIEKYFVLSFYRGNASHYYIKFQAFYISLGCSPFQ